MLGQGLDEVLAHRTQSTRNLHVFRAVVADFSENEMHEVFPIRRPKDDTQLSRAVRYLLVTQIPFANHSQQAMKLVDGEHSRGRIVDGRRQSLDGDIDQDAKREHRVLLERTLRPKHGGVPQPAIIDPGGGAVQVEDRFTHGHEIADLGHELDDTVQALCFGNKGVQIYGEDDFRPSLVIDDPPRRAERLTRRGHEGSACTSSG